MSPIDAIGTEKEEKTYGNKAGIKTMYHGLDLASTAQPSYSNIIAAQPSYKNLTL